ncbi:SRPBCC family protein [Flavobacterium sp.]|uniref:SRPBCC family protein n=1 Tax=Flavobacterium sp. TaxID=239 RepID=UPI0039E71190
MEIVIYILGTVGGLIALVLIVAMFVKKNYSLQRQIAINKSRQEVFDFVKHTQNAMRYNKWFMTDPNHRKELRGTDGTVGFVYAWDSDNKQVGKGEQEIKSMVEGQRIEHEIRFIKPFEGKADAWMETKEDGNGTTVVVWGFSSGMKYPMNIMLLFMDFEKMLGKDMETSLSNLKNVLEKE